MSDTAATPITIIGFDTETHLIGPGAVVPKIVCLSFAERADAANAPSLTGLVSTADDDFDATLYSLFEDTVGTIKAAQFAAFDLAVICAARPSLFPGVFEALERGEIHCTKLREKFLNLAITGEIDHISIGATAENPEGGTKSKIKYDLATMGVNYLGRDRHADKAGEDAWRLNYHTLEGIPVEKWPAEAVKYASDDADDVAAIWWCQEARRAQVIAEIGHDPFKTLGFRVMVDFCLYIMSAWGCATNAGTYNQIASVLHDQLQPQNLALLYESGILRPGEAPRPKARGEGMTAGKAESVNKKALTEYILAVAKKNPAIKLKYNAPTAKMAEQGIEQGSLSIDEEFLSNNWHLDPVLEQYKKRSDLQKMVTTELPRMCWPKGSGIAAPVVHPCYDALKSSGRTSSFGGDLFPSFNIQNVDPRARGIIEARPGNYLFSADYSGMELGTLAQTCLRLFGKSVLAETINAGIDPHAFLGAQLANAFDEDFRAVASDQKAHTREELFTVFKVMFKNGTPQQQAIYDHYRKFAKPTGLGYPGGLGPETFISYAKATFGIDVNYDTAVMLRDIWKDTYPEMPDYFNYIKTECKDGHNEGYYSFASPFGMYRAGASYCACSNGLGLQTPSAEGALTGMINVVRGCYDPAMSSVLYGGHVRPIGFIHDEIFGEIKIDDLMHESLDEIKRIMVDSMSIITPDVKPGVSVVLMKVWNKDAKPVFGEDKKLTVWEPTAAK